jgi:hypothetical protein
MATRNSAQMNSVLVLRSLSKKMRKAQLTLDLRRKTLTSSSLSTLMETTLSTKMSSRRNSRA